MKKSTKWYIILPGNPYSFNYYYKIPVTERIVREDLRREYNLKRLPTGTDIYTMSQNQEQIIKDNYESMRKDLKNTSICCTDF